MSDPNSRMERDLSVFDSMTTEELEGYLDNDFLLPEGESDTDAVLYILALLEKRDGASGEETAAAADAAWETFDRIYRPSADEESAQRAPTEEAAAPRPVSARRTTFRVGLTAAIVAAALLFGSLAAYAGGVDLFGAIARWTNETFGFTKEGATLPEEAHYPEALSDITELLMDNGYTQEILPYYLPEGFEPVETDSYEFSGMIVCYSLLSDGDSDIILQYRIHAGQTGIYSFEKDPGEPEIYQANGIVFYITTNVGLYRAAWTFDDVECSISGVPTREELIRIVDTIGG